MEYAEYFSLSTLNASFSASRWATHLEPKHWICALAVCASLLSLAMLVRILSQMALFLSLAPRLDFGGRLASWSKSSSPHTASAAFSTLSSFPLRGDKRLLL